jgi:nucleoside-diphosphate-sugar epimerase
MEILFTGGSSFTGMWFCEELAKAGHRITAPLLHAEGDYAGTRKERVDKLRNIADIPFECPFGSEAFLSLVHSKPSWDLFCHHAADVTDYKSNEFDYVEALRKNTFNVKNTLVELRSRGCAQILLTGSVFEPNEGAGSDGLRAVSPYGLSKGLTSCVFEYLCTILNLSLGKFVISNPFGPYEEERFTSYLVKTWFQGKTAPVSHPDYVRDNIHVSLLAKTYRRFAEHLPNRGFSKFNPSGYVGTQGEFTKRFADEMRKRLNLPCNFELHKQEAFPEPKERYNLDKLDIKELGWDEAAAWDELASYYHNRAAQ